MSRSDTIPPILDPSLLTTNAPNPVSDIVAATELTVWSGETVDTPDPLRWIISATFMTSLPFCTIFARPGNKCRLCPRLKLTSGVLEHSDTTNQLDRRTCRDGGQRCGDSQRPHITELQGINRLYVQRNIGGPAE